MKVTNKTAYATIGCDVQLSESDRLALGIELDKVTNWLETVIGDETEVAESLKAINNIVAFVSKFAIRPSQSNVFTDSTEDFKKADETVTTDDKRMREALISVLKSDFENDTTIHNISVGDIIAWLKKQKNKADETTTAVEPVQEDDVITIDIANAEPANLMKLIKIILNVTNLSLFRIKSIFNSAKEKHISCISFRCMNRRKEEVIDELVAAGYQIMPNEDCASLRI